MSDDTVCPMIGHLFFHQLSGSGMEIEMPGNQWNINIPAFPNGFSIVECFDNREEAGMFLHQTCNRIEKFCPGRTTNSFPVCLCRPGTLHGTIHIICLCLAYRGEKFTCRRIMSLEGFPTIRNIGFSINIESKLRSVFFNPFKSGLRVFRGFAVIHCF